MDYLDVLKTTVQPKQSANKESVLFEIPFECETDKQLYTSFMESLDLPPIKHIASIQPSKYKTLLYKVKKELEKGDLKKSYKILSSINKTKFDSNDIYTIAAKNIPDFDKLYKEANTKIGSNVPSQFQKPLSLFTSIAAYLKGTVDDYIGQYKLSGWDIVPLGVLFVGFVISVITLPLKAAAAIGFVLLLATLILLISLMFEYKYYND